MHESLNPYLDRVESGLLRKAISPCGRMVLFIYTEKCTYDDAWDEYTLRSRGIVFEISTGRQLARPFEKFFNLGEKRAPTLQEIQSCSCYRRNCSYVVWEKMDGSLAILFHYENEWHIVTKGSFVSDQAIRAREMLSRYRLDNLDKSLTVLLEIIYPLNRVVIDYKGKEGLYLLGAYYPERFADLTELSGIRNECKFEEITLFFGMTIEECLKKCPELTKNEEGFVVWNLLTDQRVKIKGHEYLRIHKIISNMSPLSLWEVMKEGKVPESYLMELPEEMRPEYEAVRDSLENQHLAIKNRAMQDLDLLPNKDDAKSVGLFIQQKPCPVEYPQLVFALLKGQGDRVDKNIMQFIRPDANNLKDK